MDSDTCELGSGYFTEVIAIRNIIKLADHYESMSKRIEPNDIRGPVMMQAARDMREALKNYFRANPNGQTEHHP